ncbi:MAG: MgtC/SapB family protein [Candidatus Methanoperedens sp.]|nr:MgtC/SapB family protein [Candidatus Methanoperedens sp.]
MLDLVSQTFSNMDVNINFFQKLALALLIGSLIGIEREHRRPEGEELIAGVRSFTIACITGMISSYLAQITGQGVLLITLVFFAIISAIYTYVKNVVFKNSGITGPIALYCTFLLGIMITYNLYLIAIVGGVIITLLLGEKRKLHSFASNLTDGEIQGAVRFLAVIFILYPITPDEMLLGLINPRWVLLIVIIVATISFISFVVMKELGTRYGIPLSGLLGGLVNSEATTGALSCLAKKKGGLVGSAFVGIILANSSMLIRNLLIAFIVDPSGRVFLFMLIPMLIITSFALIPLIRSKKEAHVSETIQLESPFALSSAIKFAFGFGALSIVSRFAHIWAGVAGIYATALGGFISSAVVTASATALAADGLITPGTAALTAVLASLISTGNKILLVKWSGPAELALLVKKTFTKFIIMGSFVLIVWRIMISYYS